MLAFSSVSLCHLCAQYNCIWNVPSDTKEQKPSQQFVDLGNSWKKNEAEMSIHKPISYFEQAMTVEKGPIHL